MTEALRERAEAAFRQVAAWSERRDFAGYDKHDALLSPLLRCAALGWAPLEMLAVQAVMRAPINLRPLLGVRTARNPKGIGLFLRAFAAQGAAFQTPVRELADWLLAHRSPGEAAACWGYQFPWPSLYFRAPAGSPNAIVTVFAAEGLLDAYQALGDKRHLAAARSAADWLLSLPRLIDEPNRLCLGYTPAARTRVININAVIAGFLSRLPDATPEIKQTAQRLVGYVLACQTEEGAWYYTDPASASRIEHDNYHTGGILDGLLDCLEAREDPVVRSAYERGLDFYARLLFEPDGWPRWERRSRYPADVHGAAQGIITLSRAAARHPEHGALADRVLAWTLDHLYAPDGRFHHQVGRLMTKRATLMRWGNAWMLRALSAWLQQRNGMST